MTVSAGRPLILLLAFASMPAAAAETGHPTNAGLRSPAITAIRGIYQSVEHGIAIGRMKLERRYVSSGSDDCEASGEQRTIYLDAAGTVRKYVVEPDSQDSLLVIRQYYDVLRRLRFVFITGGAVNGSRLEHRIYFDESGSRIREDHTYTAGPGYTFPSIWPAEELAEDPQRAYERTCSAKRESLNVITHVPDILFAANLVARSGTTAVPDRFESALAHLLPSPAGLPRGSLHFA
jgi:hypothetical protein